MHTLDNCKVYCVVKSVSVCVPQYSLSRKKIKAYTLVYKFFSVFSLLGSYFASSLTDIAQLQIQY